jgi:sugar phosphate isomerase/epimerase
MKLGIAGLLPNAISALDTNAFRNVASMGFTGSAFYVNDPPATITSDQAREIGRIATGEGIDLVEYGQYQTTFVDPDESVRATSLATVREACRVTRAVGCPAVIAGIGSLNPAGHWFPHPDNFSNETRERLLSSLATAVEFAEDQGVILALECHVTTSLRNAEVAREVLDAVGSTSLMIHLDPVNWITFETIYESAPAIQSMFATLGPQRIYGVHSKGARVENELIVHLNETVTGDDSDVIDHAAILRGMTTLPDNTYLILEHLPVDRIPGARDHLLAIADQIGVSFNCSPTRTAP